MERTNSTRAWYKTRLKRTLDKEFEIITTQDKEFPYRSSNKTIDKEIVKDLPQS
ncbi:28157_t:CDS:2 [Gigaspora margarita]|uniref:28157_t:CDS:1 n=1 Tax=Gigaspora margarita TaxID=4874 RepID=A0ABM8VW48_GIGMA|nr:28157_t:CDS:2 [Gigaspora margarita]